MTLEPLFSAPLAVQVHVATVVPAALIGAIVFLNRKGTPLHKALGRIWMVLMVVTALSTFFIHEIDLFLGFSPIHVISILVVIGCIRAVHLARTRQIAGHMRMVKNMYFGAIGVAGLFAFMPGRIMNRTVFGEGFEWSGVVAAFSAMPSWGWAAGAVVLGLAAALAYPRLTQVLKAAGR